MPEVYHFLFLKEAEAERPPWELDTAKDLLLGQKLDILEETENDKLIVLTVAPKPTDDRPLRMVSLTETVFMLVEDVGFEESETPPPTPSE